MVGPSLHNVLLMSLMIMLVNDLAKEKREDMYLYEHIPADVLLVCLPAESLCHQMLLLPELHVHEHGQTKELDHVSTLPLAIS